MLKQKLKKMGKENLEVHLIYKNKLNGIETIVIWKDPCHCYTLTTDRLITFEELYMPVPANINNVFEFNLSNILGNMAAKVLAGAKRYKMMIGENVDEN